MRCGYFDIHCHILPGMDDGPKTIEETIALARALIDDGAAGVIATPHVSLGSDIPKFLAKREDALKAAGKALHAANIKLDLKSGAEVMIPQCNEPALDYLAVELNARELCLADTNLILIEYPEGPEPLWFEQSIFRLQSMGLQPVIAHAERYSWLRSKKRMAALVEKGLYIQVGCESFNGFFNQTSRLMRAAAEKRLIHFIASDAHDPVKRGPKMGRIDVAGYYWQMENAKALYKHSENSVFYAS